MLAIVLAKNCILIPIIFRLFLIFSGASPDFPANNSPHIILENNRVEAELYNHINWNNHPPAFEVFCLAIKGYEALQDSLHLFEKPLLTIIDYSKPSNYERLWVINLESEKLLINTLVAHGRNSGEVTPDRFSNTLNSYQSSLGFYCTGNTYIGKHGLSLKLHGIEPGINDRAEQRAIVIHGADYVSEKYIAGNGRLGRSHGCPAVAVAVHRQLIKLIQDKTCLFAYFPERVYFDKSVVLNRKKNAAHFALSHQ